MSPAGGKAGDEKLIKGNTYGTAYITEVNECSEVFIQEVFDRTLSSPDRKIFHDLNPKAEGHWYYRSVLNFHEEKQKADPAYGLNYGHFTIADNMSLSDAQLRAVLATYDRKSIGMPGTFWASARPLRGSSTICSTSAPTSTPIPSGLWGCNPSPPGPLPWTMAP